MLARPRGQIYIPHQARTDGAITVLCVWSTSTELENTMSASLSACACGHLQSTPRARAGPWAHGWMPVLAPLPLATSIANCWPARGRQPAWIMWMAPGSAHACSDSCRLRAQSAMDACAHDHLGIVVSHGPLLSAWGTREAGARFLKVRTDQIKIEMSKFSYKPVPVPLYGCTEFYC